MKSRNFKHVLKLFFLLSTAIAPIGPRMGQIASLETPARQPMGVLSVNRSHIWFERARLKPCPFKAYRQHHARALSIIASQMSLDLRMSSTASRIAPWPARAFVM